MAPGHRRLLPEPGFAPREAKRGPAGGDPGREGSEENPWFPSRLEKMGRSAYSNGSRGPLASRHWAMRTAARVPGHLPR